MLSDNLNIAIHAAIEAGFSVMEIYQNQNINIELKADSSPLTQADLISNTIIHKYLKNTQIPILSEEEISTLYEERVNWKQCWIVDPIDGTKEFISGNGEFTINIALVINSIPVLGVVYAPALKVLYFAQDNLGSYKVLIDEKFNKNNILDTAVKLPSSINAEPIVRIVASRSHLSAETSDFVNQIKNLHPLVELISKGSSLKLCMIAEGDADYYPRFAPTMEWDTAAGHAICKYAGKLVIDWSTKNELQYNKKVLINNWFLAK